MECILDSPTEAQINRLNEMCQKYEDGLSSDDDNVVRLIWAAIADDVNSIDFGPKLSVEQCKELTKYSQPTEKNAHEKTKDEGPLTTFSYDEDEINLSFGTLNIATSAQINELNKIYLEFKGFLIPEYSEWEETIWETIAADVNRNDCGPKLTIEQCKQLVNAPCTESSPKTHHASKNDFFSKATNTEDIQSQELFNENKNESGNQKAIDSSVDDSGCILDDEKGLETLLKNITCKATNREGPFRHFKPTPISTSFKIKTRLLEGVTQLNNNVENVNKTLSENTDLLNRIAILLEQLVEQQKQTNEYVKRNCLLTKILVEYKCGKRNKYEN